MLDFGADTGFAGCVRRFRLAYAPKNDDPERQKPATLHHLSLQQKAAVQHLKDPLLILGGAGSGKTSLLAHKIAWLMREHGVPPDAIVALAAAPATAATLRRQVTEVLGQKVPALEVASFTEFALRLVQRVPEAVGLRPGFSVYDRSDSEALVAQLLAQVEPDRRTLAPAVWRRIADWKRAGAVPRAPAALAPEAHAALRLYDAYQRRLHAANALDLEDLARKALEACLHEPSLLAAWRTRVRFLLLDEYERAGADAHELVRLLAGSGVLLTAAADDCLAGAVHGWGRGASLARLTADLPTLRVIRLQQNFRSRPAIVALAERLVPARASGGAKPALPAEASAAGAASVVQTRSDQQEAEALVALLDEHRRRAGGDFSDYAILLRRAALAGPVEHALRTHRVPYYTRGIASFFGRTEIRDLRAYLRLLCNPADDVAFLRALETPRRDLERAELERLAARARTRGRALFECALAPGDDACVASAPLRELVALIARLRKRAEAGDAVGAARALLADLRYEEWLCDSCNDATIAARRMENVARLIELLARLQRDRPDAGLRALMAQLDLEAVRALEADEGASEGVALMTLAAARGMEFRHVYLVGFEQAPGAPEPPDERYWAYLGVTRAAESVVFTLAEHRRTGGALTARRPSGFLAELPTQALAWSAPDALRAPIGPPFPGAGTVQARSRV